jgi:hypothetical protein
VIDQQIEPGMKLVNDDGDELTIVSIDEATWVVWVRRHRARGTDTNDFLDARDLRREWTLVPPIDVTNWALVSALSDDRFQILNPAALAPFTRAQALAVAAWLVVMAERDEGEFDQYLQAVMRA